MKKRFLSKTVSFDASCPECRGSLNFFLSYLPETDETADYDFIIEKKEDSFGVYCGNKKIAEAVSAVDACYLVEQFMYHNLL
ncbi:MAG: hypothetical protein L0Y62_05005, partial [Nitrospirae bacterium]|nr:hypothetical protein [Nitrospirota bacterium]